MRTHRRFGALARGRHVRRHDRIGIDAMGGRRVLALLLLTIDNGLVVHVDALAGKLPVPQ